MEKLKTLTSRIRLKKMENNYLVNLNKRLKFILLAASMSITLMQPAASNAFPVYAQQAYENPREATGRIVCANCHLAQKPVEIEVPQGVLPDSVFEVTVEIPYDLSLKQVTGDGTRGPLNVGAVVILPEGFKLAPKDRLSEELKEKN
jgi:apocytochrome f